MALRNVRNVGIPLKSIGIGFVSQWGDVEVAQFSSYFSNLTKSLSNFEKFLSDAAGILRTSWHESFERQARPSPWKPLAESTVRKWGKVKEMRWGDRKIIGRLSGDMMNAYTLKTDENHYEDILNPYTLVIGSLSIPYVDQFQSVRPLVVYTPSDREDLSRAFAEYVEASVNNS
jgi:hypothetical protein